MNVMTKKDPRVSIHSTTADTVAAINPQAGWRGTNFQRPQEWPRASRVMTSGENKRRDAANVFRQSPPARDQSARLAGDSFSHLGGRARPARWSFHHSLKVASKCKCGFRARKIKAWNFRESLSRSLAFEQEKELIISARTAQSLRRKGC